MRMCIYRKTSPAMENKDVLKRMWQGMRDVEEWRNFLKTHGKGDYKVYLDSDPFAKVDVMQLTPSGARQYVELKERRVRVDQYPDCLVDADKVRTLQEIDSEGHTALLVALYPKSGIVATWRVREEDEYEVKEITCNAVTVQGAPPTKRKKRMVSLKLKDAVLCEHRFSVSL